MKLNSIFRALGRLLATIVLDFKVNVYLIFRKY